MGSSQYLREARELLNIRKSSLEEGRQLESAEVIVGERELPWRRRGIMENSLNLRFSGLLRKMI